MSRHDYGFIDVGAIGKSFLDLSNRDDISLAMNSGLLDPVDSPKGFLCTLCGAMVASARQHTAYHHAEKNFMRVVLIKLGVIGESDD